MTDAIYQKYEEKINELFENFRAKSHKRQKEFNEIVERRFLYSKFEKKDVLFVGLNPSFGEDAKKIESYLSFSAKGNDHPYFNKFNEFFKKEECKKTGEKQSKYYDNWTFIDLLFIRETKQSMVKDFYNSEDSDFIKAQLDISMSMIEEIKPKIIVVCDTFSRDLITKKLDLDLEKDFNPGIGTYRIENKNSKLYRTILFFSGMLSGQRALDLGSFKRLQWHIENVDKLNLHN